MDECRYADLLTVPMIVMHSAPVASGLIEADTVPDPWCPDAGVRHKHTRLFRKACVIAEDGTILEAER